MAPVVKRLRPRIVVPICMGSNPITRPIKKDSKESFIFFKSRIRVMNNTEMRGEKKYLDCHFLKNSISLALVLKVSKNFVTLHK